MTIRNAVLALCCLAFSTIGWAGTPGGGGELSLDGTALSAWADRALPRSWTVPIGGGRNLELRRGLPEEPELSEAGIRWVFPVTVHPGGAQARIALDLVPHWDRTEGRLEFVATELELLQGELPIAIPASWLAEFPTWKLPRTLDWTLPGEGANLRVVAWLQGYSLSRDRLTLEFGLGYP